MLNGLVGLILGNVWAWLFGKVKYELIKDLVDCWIGVLIWIFKMNGNFGVSYFE